MYVIKDAQYHVCSKQNVVTRVVPEISTPQYLIPTCSHLGTGISIHAGERWVSVILSVMTIDKTDPVVLQ